MNFKRGTCQGFAHGLCLHAVAQQSEPESNQFKTYIWFFTLVVMTIFFQTETCFFQAVYAIKNHKSQVHAVHCLCPSSHDKKNQTLFQSCYLLFSCAIVLGYFQVSCHKDLCTFTHKPVSNQCILLLCHGPWPQIGCHAS